MPQTFAAVARARLRLACFSGTTRNEDMSMKGNISMALALVLASAGAHAQERVRIANEGGIRGEWMLAPGVQLSAPGYPGAFA